jgi:hypothetical protein
VRILGLCPILAAVLLTALSACARAQTPAPPLDLRQAQAVFVEAKRISAADGGRLWGEPLYGPMLLVDPTHDIAVANQPAGLNLLHHQGDLYAGRLPEDLVDPNPFARNGLAVHERWAGKLWTALVLPLPADRLSRRELLAHELFARIQRARGLEPAEADNYASNDHLDTVNGSIWLQLEWRALARALLAGGDEKLEAIRDALAFRAQRHELFPGKGPIEARMEIWVGLAEYTGLVAGAPDRSAARWQAVARLVHPDTSQSYDWTDAFVNASAPAYGMLLDEHAPGWRTRLTPTSDLAAMLAQALPPAAQARGLPARAADYGEAAIRAAEDDMAARYEAVRARYRALLVEAPVLVVPLCDYDGAYVKPPFSYQRYPQDQIDLKPGTVYPTSSARGAWGKLRVGAGMRAGGSLWVIVTVPFGTQGPHITGPGWTLDLAPGWQVVPYTADPGRPSRFVPGTLTLHKTGERRTERERLRQCAGY